MTVLVYVPMLAVEKGDKEFPIEGTVSAKGTTQHSAHY